MKYTIYIVLVTILSSCGFSYANPIDDNCPNLTYDKAPVVNADQYLCNTEYAVAYSYTTKNPIYSTELLLANHTGNLPRTNDFREDTRIPLKYQATLSDYYKSICNTNGEFCDRGHITPNQDFSSCDICVHESFLLSNMLPQSYKSNRGQWKSLEIWIRKYVSNHPDGVYVITGPIYDINHLTIGNGVWVPNKLFKVVIDAKYGTSISFIMDNGEVSSFKTQIHNIEDIENLTKIVFNFRLNKTQVSNINDWK